MSGFLTKVMEERRRDALLAAQRVPQSALAKEVRSAPPRRSLQNLAARDQARAPAIIAELKRGSPSAGQLRAAYQPAALAAIYAQAGAAAISVLTEPRYFLGSAAHLRAVRQAVDLPILLKDFISTPYQVWEAAALGADVVLLIAAGLDLPTLHSLAALAREIGLEVLVEVHDQVELERVSDMEQVMLGVNTRDLQTLQVDLEVAARLAPLLPVGRLCIAESGIRTRQDIERLGALGYGGFLIGEALMRAPDIGLHLKTLLGLAPAPAGTGSGCLRAEAGDGHGG
ncbi:MAG: indole-3-glycerol phosphate synthase TrpC [Lentisphaerae bacterium]|nr:indole-3-glycerol phosphate synthase TrpC [Lentisphaerota bacterium]